MQRHYSLLDRGLIQFDQGLRTLLGQPKTTGRENPAKTQEYIELSQGEKTISSRLMRVNHTGEVCAQALYQGQAFTAKLDKVKTQMEQAAAEENDHLDWCQQRLDDLGSHSSYLNPLFYAQSLAIGSIAGLIGDKWSLGFVAETEKQVVKHLDEHLQRLPDRDKASQAILQQMREDELHHATQALHSGGVELPKPIKFVMHLMSKVMTNTTYWM